MKEFKKGETYQARLLKDLFGCYDIKYGNLGDIISLKHGGNYRGNVDCLYVIEGHGYGTPFFVGIDIELIEGLP